MPDWSPTAYLRYTDERSRPFAELLARVPGRPATVVDLGCGPGHLTGRLRARWPDADVLGIDASPAMIERASADNTDPHVRYEIADLRDLARGRASVAGADLVLSNAALQWVPDHRRYLAPLAAAAAQTFAFQVPGNHDAPSHTLLREVAARAPYADVVGAVPRRATADPAEYLDLLAAPGWAVDAWETTYTHVLDGPDPVLRWIAATGAQPTLQALAAHDAAHGTALHAAFEAEYGAALRDAYPERSCGTPLAFRRVFVVATRVG
ncbi:trans-aconitate 2-methyltransferase [Isoptericola sp. CG 20/1183]|uniref:Trans-aconitate 2-methyltransferase n=1 Tax=Isoptericola halotolerans TaxID=300560 RepID=A0ABX5EF68_9MICO|nr:MULTISPECIES: methyltransferase domain-containing protein [Isoptericola]PRZ05529.1 trans-aconitate 2-methyltransferase [Isoptericola halotolerans]PRZ06097.1 trans-aconitate 2-methyltransferase [Isoptericola sp. CG 20/1183]